MKKFALFASALILSASASIASATPLTYNTAGSTFTCSSCTTNTGTAITVTGPTAGDVATITYTGPGPGPGNVTVNTPTNISYGFFTLSYVGNAGDTINIPAFTFNLMVNDVTDSTSALFTGTAAAGMISANSSSVGVNWTPLTLPNGARIFTITSPTLLPSDNTLAGQASIQGTVTNAVTPEPSSLMLMGTGLCSAAGMLVRRRRNLAA